MSNYWKSRFLVWFLAFVLTVVHNVLWGAYDLSSLIFGVLFVYLMRLVESFFDLDRHRSTEPV